MTVPASSTQQFELFMTLLIQEVVWRHSRVNPICGSCCFSVAMAAERLAAGSRGLELGGNLETAATNIIVALFPSHSFMTCSRVHLDIVPTPLK